MFKPSMGQQLLLQLHYLTKCKPLPRVLLLLLLLSLLLLLFPFVCIDFFKSSTDQPFAKAAAVAAVISVAFRYASVHFVAL